MENLWRVVGDIYEASHHPERWSGVVKTLCTEVVGARAGSMFLENDRSGACRELGHFGGSAESVRQMVGHGGRQHLCQRLPLAANDMCGGGLDSALSEDGWHLNVAMYGPFLRPLSAERSTQMMTFLAPHLRRAVRHLHECHVLRFQQQTLQSALSNLVAGLIILGPDNTVVYQNPTAESILARHPAMRITAAGRLIAHHRAENHRLAVMVRQLSRQRLPRESEVREGVVRDMRRDHAAAPFQHAEPQALTLSHPDKSSPLSVMLSPLSAAQQSHAPHAGCVALYLSSDEHSFAASPSVLNALYGLSRAESAVDLAE